MFWYAKDVEYGLSPLCWAVGSTFDTHASGGYEVKLNFSHVLMFMWTYKVKKILNVFIICFKLFNN